MDKCISNLAAATMLQAIKDYFDPEATTKERRKIIKELTSEWMLLFTNDRSAIVADKLLKEPDVIKERMNIAS